MTFRFSLHTVYFDTQVHYALCIHMSYLHIQGGPKNGLFLKCATPVYVDIAKLFICSFLIESKIGVLHITAFKYSLHDFTVMTLRH